MSKINKNSGLTTIEAIFAILIVVVGLVVYASSLNLVRSIKSTRYQDIAYHIASKQMEILRNTDFSSLPASAATTDPRLQLLPSGSGYLTVTDINSDLKHVNASVSWLELGNTKSVNMDTYIYLNGLNNL